jgi:hypothetical protein
MLRNIANLLKSGPDAASPSFDGRALVAKKVKRLDIMGGKPSAIRQQTRTVSTIEDAPSTALCAIPGRLILSS